MKKNLLPFLFIVLLSACHTRERAITSFSDYENYLKPTRFAGHDPKEQEFEFWNARLVAHPGDEISLVKLAGLSAGKFRESGQIQDIKFSDSLYAVVLEHTPGGSVDLYHCLAANAITQHQFRRAKEYAEKALALKDKKASTLLLLTDVSFELGDYARVRRILDQFKNKNSFAYLIRAAKLKDHEGSLEEALALMERAYQRVKGNQALSQWTLSNLADMYMHHGMPAKSYQTYLTVLHNNPTYDYALKGIAWLALSHDHNARDSKVIIEALATRKRMPEAYLMLAEIASMEGNEKEKEIFLNNFVTMASQPAYKTMYHKYLATLEADAFNDPEACIKIANEEIANRPTPQSYDLLAWGYYRQKDYKRALEIAQKQVEGQTFEPAASYHLGMIYLAAGNVTKSRHYLEEALVSKLELGPLLTAEIRSSLNKL